MQSLRSGALVALAVLAAAVATPVSAQTADPHAGHGMVMDAAPKGDAGPSSIAYAAANAAMHQAMDITFTGDADVDFVRGMIAHHEGAIAMAKIQLEFGKDAAIRALSEAVIVAQEKEVAEMKAWLTAKGLE